MSKIDPDRLLMACEESMFGTEDMGFCIACGEEHINIEPDAEKYLCEACDEKSVYGAEQLLLMGYAE